MRLTRNGAVRERGLSTWLGLRRFDSRLHDREQLPILANVGRAHGGVARFREPVGLLF